MYARQCDSCCHARGELTRQEHGKKPKNDECHIVNLINGKMRDQAQLKVEWDGWGDDHDIGVCWASTPSMIKIRLETSRTPEMIV